LQPNWGDRESLAGVTCCSLLQHDACKTPTILTAVDDAGILSGGNDAWELLGTCAADSCSVNAGNGNVSIQDVNVVFIENIIVPCCPRKLSGSIFMSNVVIQKMTSGFL
jgi:hypothetical protein